MSKTNEAEVKERISEGEWSVRRDVSPSTHQSNTESSIGAFARLNSKETEGVRPSLRKPKLTPTDIANFTYCPRLLQLSQLLPTSASSFNTVWGSYEHEVFRLLFTKFRSAWSKENDSDALTRAAMMTVDDSLQYAFDLACQIYPQFALQIRSQLPELRHRLSRWIDLKLLFLASLIRGGITYDQAVGRVLPWRTEERLYSKKIGLSGRTDALYNDGHSLVVEDIKTHDSRFDAYLRRESHQFQLLCYAAMAEETYSIPCFQTRIFFSRDLTYSKFEVSSGALSDLYEKCEGAKKMLSASLAPILQGTDSIKCQNCYLRTRCYNIEAKQQENGISNTEAAIESGDGLF